MASISANTAHPLVGFIGAGNMARSLAGGLLKNGWSQAQVTLADPDSAQREAIQTFLGVNALADNNTVATRADILVLAIKPQIFADVAKGLAATVQKKKPLVISVAAGIRIEDIDRWLGGNLPVVPTDIILNSIKLNVIHVTH